MATPTHSHPHPHPHSHPAVAALAADSNPVLVEVTRGTMVESRHRGAAAIVSAEGEVVGRWGDIEPPIYARSAIKPLQAIPLVESGAADHFGLGDAEIALACASHNGEPRHVATVAAWLERIGLTPADLECGIHPPYHDSSAAALQRAGEAPSPLHNNCSGKHAGFLATAVFRKERPRGYVRLDHPVQQRILGLMEQLCGLDLGAAPKGIDGCGIPVIGLPLGNLALGMARMAKPATLPKPRIAAIARIRRAMAAEPFMVAGSGRFCTRVMTALGDRALVKTGAEGVFTAILPRQGLGVAVKVADGATRAAEVAMAALLRHLGVLDPDRHPELADLLVQPIRNRAGAQVGEVRPAPGFPA